MSKMFEGKNPIDEATQETEEIQGEQIPIKAMRTDGASQLEKAKALVVKDLETFNLAQSIADECARRIKRVKERFAKADEKSKDAAEAAKKARSSFLDLVRGIVAPYEEVKTILDRKARTWQAEENKRLAAEAEEKRKTEQKKLDEARQKEIDDAKAKGDDNLAVELAEKPPEVAAVVAEKVESAKGTTNKAHWKAVCYDLMELLKAIVAGEAPISLVEFNQSEGDALARANKDSKQYRGVAFKDVGQTQHRVS